MELVSVFRGSNSIVALLMVLMVSTGSFVAGADGGPRITLHDGQPGDGGGGLPESAAGEPSLSGAPGGDLMQQLLNWGIEHSDPERLQELMKKYQENNLTIKDVYGQDVIDALFVNEASVMQNSIKQVASFGNASVADEDLETALNTLRDLVEQVDNAGNLHRMGGLRPLLDLGAPSLSSSDGGGGSAAQSRSPPVRAGALWTLGVAVQNNEPVQTELLSLDGLTRLVARLALCPVVGGNSAEDERTPGMEGAEYCGKLLFAISGLVRNNATTQAAADGLGLFSWLLDVVSSPHASGGLTKKSLGLIDSVLAQSPDLPFLDGLSRKQEALASTLIHHLGHSFDLDMTEKVLRLVNRLLSLRPMLFPSDFRSRLNSAVSNVVGECEKLHGAGDELCTGLAGLAKHADLALAARELTDEEL